MNYHITIDDKFIEGFIEDAEKVSLPNSNRYFVRGKKESAVYIRNPKVEWIDDVYGERFRKILNTITINDKIFIHWYDLYIGKLMLTINPEIPLYVALWGGDFFEDPYLYHKNWVYDKKTRRFVNRKLLYPKVWARQPHIFIKQLLEILKKKRRAKEEYELKRKTVQRINYILTDKNFFADVELVKRIYKISFLPFLPFNYDQNFNIANQIRTSEVKRNNSVVIQIGNSANESNNHVDIFNVLKNKSKEDIKIEIPLSYGDTQYAAFVKREGTKIFGSKLIAIENFVSREEYIQRLNQVDVCIMYHNRQQALGNCVALLALGKKLYLKRKNPLYQLFEKIGVKVLDALTIGNLSFEEFIKPLSKDEIGNNILRLDAFFSDKQRYEYLKILLN